MPIDFRGLGSNVVIANLLKAVKYNPLAGHTYSLTSVTAADVDAVNLAATFTVPASGNVIAVLSALILPDITDNIQFCLRSGSSIVAGSDEQMVRVQAGGSVPFDYRANYRALITGLTPGSVTWKWAAYGTGSMVVGGAADGSSTAGMALMEFYGA